MFLRVVAANQTEARFYDVGSRYKPLNPVLTLKDSRGRWHDRRFKSDRPGRVFNRASVPGRRRGASARHATGGERTPHKYEAERFARRIAHELEAMHLRSEFHYLAIMAAPGFLGLLRAALSKPLAQAVVATVRKDLLKQTDSAVKTHLPRHLFGIEGPFRPDFD